MPHKTPFREQQVVTAFLQHQGRVLIVRRSRAVGTYRGRWSAISGYLEEAAPLRQALVEVREETGLPEARLHLVAQGAPLHLEDAALRTRWTVHPFLFDVESPDAVKLDWENVEMQWVHPDRLADFVTVPGLADAYRHCVEAMS